MGGAGWEDTVVQAETVFYLSESQRAHLLLTGRRKLLIVKPVTSVTVWLG